MFPILAQVPAAWPISFIVNLWIEQAAAPARHATFQRLTQQLLAIAEAGTEPCDLTILLDADGGLFVSAASDWPLDRLAAERGAEAGWRIRRQGDSVAIEGQAGLRRCRLESARAGLPHDVSAQAPRLLGYIPS